LADVRVGGLMKGGGGVLEGKWHKSQEGKM
jgi:hypothetical protein